MSKTRKLSFDILLLPARAAETERATMNLLAGDHWFIRKVFRFRRVNGNDLVIIGYASKIVSFENNIFGIFCKLITSTTRWTRGESSKYNL